MMRVLLPALLLALAGCTVERVVDAPTARTAATADPYCAEAMAEAQAAANQAAMTAAVRDAGRGDRTVAFAQRDCR